MESKRSIFLIMAVLLIVFNFSVQNFNFLKMEMAPCSLFYWISNCVEFHEFAINKIVRLLINSLTITLMLNFFNWKHLHFKKVILVVIFCYGADMALCYSNFSLFVNWHKVLNPVLYSPLLIIVYSAYMFSHTFNSKK